MKYYKSNINDMQSLNDVYAMLIENCRNPQTRYHPAAGDFAFLINFEEERDAFFNKAVQWRNCDGILAGVVWTDYRNTYYICTRQTDSDIYNVILDDIEAKTQEGEEIWIWSCDNDTTRQNVLKERGYGANGFYMFYGHKSLVDFSPNVNLPNGYKIREFTDTDISDKVYLMGVSMEHVDSRTIEKYRDMQQCTVYDKRTDLVVVDKNNKVVAFINGWLDETNKMGMIEPCGTSPEHSGKGLMTNLMNRLFAVYKQLGATDVYVPHGGMCLYSDEVDDAMRLYTKLGFKEVFKMLVRIKNYDPTKHDEYENWAYEKYKKEEMM